MQLRPQVDASLCVAACCPVLLAQGLYRRIDVFKYLAFTFGEGRARCGFPQGDIDEAFLADGDDEAAFVLEAAIAIPGFVVLAVLEARGRKIPQAEDAELFVTGGRQVIGIQQECTRGKYIQRGASLITG